MKKILVVAILLACSSAFAAGGLMEKDGNKIVIPGFAPNGMLSQILGVGSVTYDMSKDLAWGLYAPSAGCKVRSTPTSAKSVYPQLSAQDGQFFVRVVNQKTPFTNFSGCIGAELQRQ